MIITIDPTQDDGIYPYAYTHIEGLSPEIIDMVIRHPDTTYYDLDALNFSVQNTIGMNSPLLDVISQAISKLVVGR